MGSKPTENKGKKFQAPKRLSRESRVMEGGLGETTACRRGSFGQPKTLANTSVPPNSETSSFPFCFVFVVWGRLGSTQLSERKDSKLHSFYLPCRTFCADPPSPIPPPTLPAPERLMAAPSPLALTLIILALMAVASAPLAGAQEYGEPMNIVPALPPKPCPKFTIAHIAVSIDGSPSRGAGGLRESREWQAGGLLGLLFLGPQGGAGGDILVPGENKGLEQDTNHVIWGHDPRKVQDSPCL